MSIRDTNQYQGEDARSSREKLTGIKNAAIFSASLLGLIAAQRKVAITRGISKEIIGAGLSRESRFEKYLSATVRGAVGSKKMSRREMSIAGKLKDSGVEMMDMLRDLVKPVPKGKELWEMSIARHEKQSGYPRIAFPRWRELGVKERPLWETIWKGPLVVPFSAGTHTGFVGKHAGYPRKVGEYGGTLVGDKLYFLNNPKKASAPGGVWSRFAIPGMRSAMVGSWGSNLEKQRLGLIRSLNPKNTSQYISSVEIGSQSVIDAESRPFIEKYYVQKHLPGFNVARLKGKS